MTIQITKPEVEALINQRLQTGRFKEPKMSSSKHFSLRPRRQ